MCSYFVLTSVKVFHFQVEAASQLWQPKAAQLSACRTDRQWSGQAGRALGTHQKGNSRGTWHLVKANDGTRCLTWAKRAIKNAQCLMKITDFPTATPTLSSVGGHDAHQDLPGWLQAGERERNANKHWVREINIKERWLWGLSGTWRLLHTLEEERGGPVL